MESNIGNIAKELISSTKDLVQSEIHLAKAEIKQSGTQFGKNAGLAAACGAFAALGILPLLAFFVISLGRALNGRYWLSSLLVAAICMVVGGGLAFYFYNKLKHQNLKLPRTRQSIEDDKLIVTNKVDEISRKMKGKAA
jgi:uncharacterized membrane protein YqjE